jgi:hypothetical protein
MSEEDKLEKYLKINEIPPEKIERYMNAGIRIINSSEMGE